MNVQREGGREWGRRSGVPRSRSHFSLSCVVPVFNEGQLIADFLEKLHMTLAQLSSDIEIIVVNDGSIDNSADEIDRVMRYLPIHYIELSRNFGKEFALQAGLDAVQTDCVVIMDADFQHPIETIPEMVGRWSNGADMVYTTKATRRAETWLSKLGSLVFYRLLMPRKGVKFPRDAGDFRLLDRKVVDALRAMPERNRFMKGMYAWVGFKSEAIAIEMAPRPAGQSKFGFFKLTSLALTGITAFSNIPLRLVTGIGIGVSILAVLMAIWIVVERLFLHQSVPGFATLAAAIFFFSGIQLIALGVVGEYVGRIFNEVKQRPRYLVSYRANTSPLANSAGQNVSVLPGATAAFGTSVLGVTPRRRRSDFETRAQG
jgi:glycosyltransferase involved in cell wall biosynthesis